MNEHEFTQYMEDVQKILMPRKYLVQYVNQLLWAFSTDEIFVYENILFARNKRSEIIKIQINDISDILIQFRTNRKKYEISVDQKAIKIAKTCMIKNENKETSIMDNRLYFDENGQLIYSDIWNAIIKQKYTEKKEFITIYEKDKLYGYNKYESTFKPKNKELFCGKIEDITMMQLENLINSKKINQDNIQILDSLFEKINHHLDVLIEKTPSVSSYENKVLDIIRTYH